ncbi:MAG: hypothetical protein NZ773_03125 [Dehalococcoidia bacterium]|nr:hypothetical protein [Dehalococcoidia bacterium]
MDDLDRLYARLEPLPLPADFVVHVMTQVRRQEARARRRRFAGWLVADLVAALVLGWAAFSVGRVLALGAFDQGAVELLFDLDLALAAPLPWLIAIGELAPVVAFVCLIAAGAVVAVATRALLSGAARGARVI